MERLVDAFNPAAVAGLMCRNTLSVGWDGRLYDCDFNQMLELGPRCAGGAAPHPRLRPGAPGASADRHRPPLLRLHRRRRQLCGGAIAISEFPLAELRPRGGRAGGADGLAFAVGRYPISLPRDASLFRGSR